MSTDLEIELFGKDLFDFLWKHHGLGKGPPEPKHPPRESEFVEKMFRAVQVRLAILSDPYEKIFKNTHWVFKGNLGEFYATIVETFPHYVDWARNPSPEIVMSMFLYSCAFVAGMCMYCRPSEDDFLDVAHEVWAMFVDLHLKDKFYEYGGWEKLRKFVDHDAVVHDYMKNFSDVDDNELGKNIMSHLPQLTCSAVESFDEFEAWEAVDADAPLALKWVDYCVEVPFMKIRHYAYYFKAVAEVFQKIEDTMLDLGYILNLDREGDYFEATECSTGSPKTKAAPDVHDGKSQTKQTQSICTVGLENTSSFPIASISHSDTRSTLGIVEIPFAGLDGENLLVTNPDNILRSRETFKDPDHAARIDRIVSLFGEKKRYQNPEIDSFVTEEVKPDKVSGVADQEKCDGAASGLLSLGLVITHNNHNDTQPKVSTNANDFDSVMDQLGLEKFSEYAPPDSKRRVEVYLKTADLDNIAVLGESREGTPVKSPLASPNVNVLSAPSKSPLTSPNISVLSTSPDKDSFCPSHMYLDIDDPSKDEKKTLLDEKIHGPTPELPKTDKDVQKDDTIMLKQAKSFLLSPSRDPMWSCLDVHHQNSVLKNDNDENDHILDKSLKLLEPQGENEISRPFKEIEYGLGNRQISQGSSSREIYQVTEGEKSSAELTVENQLKLASGAGAEKTKNAKTTLDFDKSLNAAKDTNSAETTNENPLGKDGKKAKKKKSKKRITRLEQRVKEEGDGVHDVSRLIFVMGVTSLE